VLFVSCCELVLKVVVIFIMVVMSGLLLLCGVVFVVRVFCISIL